MRAFLTLPRPPTSTLFPYTTLFRSHLPDLVALVADPTDPAAREAVDAINVKLTDPNDAGRFASDVAVRAPSVTRSEEHTSELQSHSDLVCRLLLEKKKVN